MKEYIPGKGVVEKTTSESQAPEYIPGKGVVYNASENSDRKEFSWPRFSGEKLASGVKHLLDMPQHFVEGVKDFFDPRIPVRDGSPKDLAYQSAHPYEPIVSASIDKMAKKMGVDLHSQGKGNTPMQRVAGAALESAPSAILGGLSGLARNATTAAAIGGGSQALQETTKAPPLLADILAILGVSKGRGFLENFLSPKSATKLSEAEIRVANAIKSQMTEDEIANAIKNIENFQTNKISGYEPLTAEIAESPAIAQIHRVRQGVPNSGIAHQEGIEHNKLINAFNEREIAPIESRQLQDELRQELSNRKSARHAATHENYQKIKGIEEKLNPKELKSHLKSEVSRGSIEKDLNAIRRDIKPRSDLSSTKKRKQLATYKKEMASIESYKGTPYYDALKANVNKPGFLEPSVGELWAAKKAINSKIKARKKAGQDENVQALTEAKKALEKDLEAVPLIKETDKLYRELSIPVDEIKKHPKLGKIIKSTANDVTSDLFDKSSYDNAVALKNALGKHEAVWSGIEDAVVKKVRESISNISAKGLSRELSYNKFSKFMEKHEKALNEIFTKDQMELLNETGNILKGQNKAKNLGLDSGSPTQSRMRTEKDLRSLLGISEEEFSGAISKGLLRKSSQWAISKIPYLGKTANKSIDILIEGWSKGNEEKLMRLVDKFLKDKEFATKILESKNEPQIGFNKFVNNNLYKAVATTSFNKSQGEKK
jgi:hypothetical protein